MCGIDGIVHTDGSPVDPGVVDRMTQVLAHRGPDGRGVRVFDQAALGHRRLSIIDIEGGAQPLSNEDGTVWTSFNGELYNFRELRSVLEGRGHRFRSRCDTEVIVHAWEEWGDRCVERFRGMFALAVVDLRRRTLFLARDHLGIKPLVYLHTRDRFAFASEIQALLQVPGVPRDLDLRAIDQYLLLQYVPSPRTAYEQIRKLPPAHRLTVGFDGSGGEPEEYWTLRFEPDHGRSEEEWKEALDAVLLDSVRAHLVADVPFGALLSGGVDSSTVLAYMAQLLDRPVRTFSIGFPDDHLNELPWASRAARRWGTEHRTEVVEPEALEILPDLVRHYGEPFADTSAIPTWHVCRLARREVPMVLSGDGGDEAFAGYGVYQRWAEWLRYRGPRLTWRNVAPALLRRLWPGRRNRVPIRSGLTRIADEVAPWRSVREPELEHWFHLRARSVALTREDRRALWRPDHREFSGRPVEALERELVRTDSFGPIHRGQYMDVKSYLPADILTKVDIASMMHGLEVRTPLTDVRVYEFAATIPESLNVVDDGSGGREGKGLLKSLMERHYPRDFLRRRKMGFGLPAETWFGRNGKAREQVRERILDGSVSRCGLFVRDELERLAQEGGWGPVWVLTVLNEWLEQHERGPELVTAEGAGSSIPHGRP